VGQKNNILVKKERVYKLLGTGPLMMDVTDFENV